MDLYQCNRSGWPGPNSRDFKPGKLGRANILRHSECSRCVTGARLKITAVFPSPKTNVYNLLDGKKFRFSSVTRLNRTNLKQKTIMVQKLSTLTEKLQLIKLISSFLGPLVMIICMNLKAGYYEMLLKNLKNI